MGAKREQRGALASWHRVKGLRIYASGHRAKGSDLGFRA